MNHIKHTPGPWKANLYLGGAYAIDRMAPNGERLGRIAVVDGMIETKANARLIAAAPELLEALESVVAIAKEAHAHWDADRDSRVGKILLALAGANEAYDNRIDCIHAAIAKAKGEQP